MKRIKKKSIREFVSEEELKFQLYLIKYSQQLKNLREKPKDIIIQQFNSEVSSRLSRIHKDRHKISIKDTIAHEALLLNEKYVKSWKAPINEDDIIDNFNIKKQEFIEYLKEEIKNNNKKKDIAMLEYVNNTDITSNNSKEKFGEMLLLMVKNMATMPSFAGYTDNWKTDFYSNAIEKTLLYVHNFDENLISVRSGGISKAFAYVTQICFNAFVNVINIRKAEAEFIQDSITFSTSSVDGIRVIPNTESKDANYKNEIKMKIDKKTQRDSVQELINIMAKDILESNNQIKNNSNIISEILYLNTITPKEEKNKNYDDYISDLEDLILIPKYDSIVTDLVVQKPRDYVLPKAFYIPDVNFNIIVRGPLEKPKAPIKEKEIIDDFMEEWL